MDKIAVLIPCYNEAATVAKVVADYRANILTIHQSIPVGGIALLTLSVEILPATGDLSPSQMGGEI